VSPRKVSFSVLTPNVTKSRTYLPENSHHIFKVLVNDTCGFHGSKTVLQIQLERFRPYHGLEQNRLESGLHQSDTFGFKVDIQSASDKSVIAAGVKPVDHRDISKYVPLIRHDEIDLIFPATSLVGFTDVASFPRRLLGLLGKFRFPALTPHITKSCTFLPENSHHFLFSRFWLTSPVVSTTANRFFFINGT
jgi:hypothetical protein